MKKTVYICLLLLVLSCTSREKPYSCKLVELQDLNTFPAIDLTPTSIALTDTTLLNPEKIWISDTLLIKLKILNRHLETIKIIGGVILILMGLIFLSGQFNRLAALFY